MVMTGLVMAPRGIRMSMSVTLILAVVLVAGLSMEMVVAQPARGLGVAVVDFYAPSPLPPVEGIIPEERAADDLSSLLIKAAGSQITVLSRGAVRQAESAIGWRGADVLRFARVEQLARALNADRVVLGWIERLDLDRGGGGGLGGGGAARHFMTGFAMVRVQVFDARQGRIIFQVQESASEIGVIRGRVAEQLLTHVLERVLPPLLSVL
jgi:hypothetical protein